MAIEFTMPQLGLTMTEGTVSKWLKKVGDPVAAGDLLVEISTDKITNEIEATASGTLLQILVPEGSTAVVKAPIAVIGDAGSIAPASAAAGTQEANGWIKASPLARKIAQQQGIDLGKVSGTGPGERVLERDVLAFVQAPPPPPKATPLAKRIAAEHGLDWATLDQGKRIMKADVLASLPHPVGVPPATPATTGVPLSGMRKIIAERMSLSWQTAPHVHLTMEVDMSEAIRLKQKLAETGLKISYTDIIVKCAAQTLAEFPMVNNRFADGALVENKAINIGIAVGLDNGLIVPVVKNAERKSLRALSEEVTALSTKARDGKLSPDEYSGGTFTITNLGMYGVDHFTPVINPPESAILGVCRLTERPVVVNSAVAVRPMMNLCLAFDHRLIDGVLAARFMARLRQYLEQPMLLL